METGIGIAAAGEFDVIYCDPPWQYRRSDKKLRGTCPYPTMSFDELRALHIPAKKEGAVLFMWTTMPMIERATELMRAWGFSYRTCFLTYIRCYRSGLFYIGVGAWARGNAQLLLLGIRGRHKMYRYVDRHDIPSVYLDVFEIGKTEHSRKPTEARVRVRALFGQRGGNLRFLEMFSRPPLASGWAHWGNECPGFPSIYLGKEKEDSSAELVAPLCQYLSVAEERPLLLLEGKRKRKRIQHQEAVGAPRTVPQSTSQKDRPKREGGCTEPESGPPSAVVVEVDVVDDGPHRHPHPAEAEPHARLP